MASTKGRRDGSGSIFQRKDGMWVAQIRTYDELAGTSKVIRRYSKTRDGAKVKLKALRADPAPTTRPRAGISLADYLTNWVSTNLPLTDIAPTTRKLYADVILWYAVPAAGKIRLAAFTPTHAEQWVARVREFKKYTYRRDDDDNVIRERAGDPLSDSTVRKVYVATVKALDTAVRDELIPTNPLRKIDAPTAGRVSVPVTSAADVDKILTAALGKPIEPLLTLVAFTGCRIGEALSLRWDDVDLDQGHATIRRGSLTRESTKTGTVREVTLLPVVVDQLKARRSQQLKDRLAMGAGWEDEQGLVFTTGSGAPMDRRTATRSLSRLLKSCGVTPSRPWHSLRHGLAHRLLTNGVPLPMVSAILGHSGIQITSDIYGHVDSRVPADVLAEALGQ